MKYTETDAEVYYDEQDELYKRCWAADGTTHWGYFEDEKIDNLQEAGWLWSQAILAKSGINRESKVLEIGCGNGAVSVWLARETGCSVVGVDISSVRIDNAREIAAAHPDLNVTFICGSITELPFSDGEFTHVWGQGVLYHVPELDRALAEIARVLAPRGVLVIDDFVGPTVPVSAPVETHFYERLKFEARYTHAEYMEALERLSLIPVEAIDMGRHIERTYALVTRAAETIDERTAEIFRACGRGVHDGEIVGFFYRCVKVDNLHEWVYESRSSEEVEARYDSWARSYDAHMAADYRSPERAAAQLLRHVPDRRAKVLDVGCGTGLVGQALTRSGYTEIHGIDLSKGMLEIAAQKQCYASLSQYDLVADRGVEGGSFTKLFTDLFPELFPVISCVGCMTFGHAPGYTLARLYRWLAPGGILQLTVRRDFMAAELDLSTLIGGLRWELLEEDTWTSFNGTQTLVGLVLEKHAAPKTPP